MPRPAPLSNASTSSYPRFDTQLTPRTPHSRAGRAEESYSAVELEQVDFDDDEYNSVVQQQHAPLLSSSASDSFPAQAGYRSRGDDYDAHDKRTGITTEKILSRLPLALYSSVAAVLLVLVFFSLREPETLKKYVGVTTNTSTSATAGDLEAIGTSTVDPPAKHPAQGVILISYENYTSFPLDPIEYRAECIKMTSGVRDTVPYWDTQLRGNHDVLHVDEQPRYTPLAGEAPICRRTMTYQLDGWAGLLSDLALMAQMAALARERNATFFVEDRFWNRGKWSDYFEDVQVGQPGPEPGCRAPPPEEYVACPRTARHWIVNSRTARYHFDHDFADHYQDPYAHNLNRMKKIYDVGFQSFSETIRPSVHTAELIKGARQELLAKVTEHYRNPRSLKGVKDDGLPMGYLGVHIRRGDRKPTWRVPYGQHYIAISDFVDAVVQSWTRLGLEISPTNEEKLVQPFVYIASDSPDAAKEFASSFSSDRVFSLSGSQNEELRLLSSPGDYFQDSWKDLDEQVRIRATRGMVVDFALLSGAWANDGSLIPEGTVCTVSSVVCRAAAFGLGWERAFGELDDMGKIDQDRKRWIDVDTKGRVIPIWEPYRAP